MPAFASLPPLAQAVAWLVLTHHRLPCKPVSQGSGSIGEDIDQPQYRWRRFGAHPRFVNAAELHGLLQRISADWNEPREDAPLPACAPTGISRWVACWPARMAQAGRTLCTQTAGAASAGGLGHGNDGPIRDARLAHVPDAGRSSLLSIEDEAQRKPYRNASYPLYANTRGNHDAPAGKVLFNQTLDEHLLGVQAHATLVARSLPTLTRSLPALQNHRGLKSAIPIHDSNGRTRRPTWPPACVSARSAKVRSSSTWPRPAAARRWAMPAS